MLRRERRRVLFLIRVLDSGGVTTHMMTLAQGLMARGWEVGLATAGQLGAHPHGCAWFEAHGVRTFQVPFLAPSLRAANLLAGLRAFPAFERVCADFEPDLLHVHFRATSPYAELASLVHHIPFVSTLHLESIPAGPLYRVGSFWGDRAIAISTETQEYLQRAFQVPAARIRLVYNGADARHFRVPTPEERLAARAALGLATQEPVVSVLGRLEPVKDHALLLHALARLRAAGTRCTALVAGEGSCLAALHAQAQALGLAGSVRFLGYCDARQVLWASDVTALPSVAEGCALVVIESMLCGVVPVRTPAAGARDQIREGVEGFIVPFGDDAALADRLARLLASAELRARLGEAAQQRACSLFTCEHMVEGTLRVYTEVVRARVRAPVRRRSADAPSAEAPST